MRNKLLLLVFIVILGSFFAWFKTTGTDADTATAPAESEQSQSVDEPEQTTSETPVADEPPADESLENNSTNPAESEAETTSNKRQTAADIPSVDANFKKFTLDNGLTLIVHEDHDTPVVAVNMWYHVGSKDEGAQQHGFAHLFEHLMFQGTEHWQGEFFEPFERAGATNMNGTTNADRTNYYATVPTPALDMALWMESDRMGYLLGGINKEELAEQVGVVINEKHQRANQPYGRVWDLIPPNSYPQGHPYSWSTIGSEKALKAATLDDVHDWFKQYYGPNNATLVLSGDIDADTALEKVKHYFGGIPAGPSISTHTNWPAPMQAEHRVAMQDKVPHPRLYMVWNVPADGSATANQLELVADLLTGGRNSLLTRELVHNQEHALSVQAGLLGRALGSQFMITATPKEGISLTQLEQEINHLLADFVAEPASDKALNTSKTRIAADFLRGMDNVNTIGQQLAYSQVFHNDPSYYQQELEHIRTASAEQVQAAAKQWLTPNKLIISVLPQAQHSAHSDEVDRSQLPDIGDAPELNLPKAETWTLDNGLTVKLISRDKAPTVQFNLVFDAGNATDPAAQAGLANLTLGMLDEGTENADAQELSEQLDQMGARLSTRAALESSSISLSALSTHADDALDILADVVAHPTFPEKEFSRLQQQTLAAIKQENSAPVQRALRAFAPAVFGKDHAYGKPLTGTGTQDSVSGMTTQDLKDFKNRWLRPDNACLIVVGNINKAELEAALKHSLGQWTAAEAEASKPNNTPAAQHQQPQIYLIEQPGLSQTTIMAGNPVPKRTAADQTGMLAANNILGGLFNSRLNLLLREQKHWSYGANSTLIETRGEQLFLAYTTVQADKTLPALNAMRQEFAKLYAGDSISQDELNFAVADMTRSLAGQNETNRQLAKTLAKNVIFNLPDDYTDQFIQQAQALSTAAVEAAAQQLLSPKNMTWIVVGSPEQLADISGKVDWAKVQYWPESQ